MQTTITYRTVRNTNVAHFGTMFVLNNNLYYFNPSFTVQNDVTKYEKGRLLVQSNIAQALHVSLVPTPEGTVISNHLSSIFVGKDSVHLYGGSTIYGTYENSHLFQLSVNNNSIAMVQKQSPLELKQVSEAGAFVHDTNRNRLLLYAPTIIYKPYPSEQIRVHQLWSFYPETETWELQQQANTLSVRYGHAMVYCHVLDSLLVFGGRSDTFITTTDPHVYQFSLTNNKWHVFCTIPLVKASEKYNLVAYMLNDDSVLLLGRSTNISNSFQVNHVLNVRTKQWHHLQHMPQLPTNFSTCKYGTNHFLFMLPHELALVKVYPAASIHKELLENVAYCDVKILCAE